MFSSFFNQNNNKPNLNIISVAPFEYNQEFEELRKIVKGFDDEEKILAEAAKEMPADSLEVKKYVLFAELNKAIRSSIKKYNESKQPISSALNGKFAAQTFGMILAVMSYDTNTSEASEDLLLYNARILDTPRDYKKSGPFNLAHYGAIAALVILSGPASILGILGYGLASHLGLRIVEVATGINGATTSGKLFQKVVFELDRMMKINHVTLNDVMQKPIEEHSVNDKAEQKSQTQLYPSANKF